jgi:alkanesulfonate monooxygenase SsuD/methylene tetrahydromethanopterin reductase-like flavin-dependent oxidoreductase (luciferase family)
MKLGILVEAEEGLDWDSWRATFSAAERLGFESLWLSDHLESPWGTRHGLETWTALAVAAAETERLLLGTLVSPVTFRPPEIVARMAASLHSLSGGRVVVGLGLGWNVEEHAAAGMAFPGASRRAELLADVVQRIRREVAVPILLGGRGTRVSLPLVARYADEWNATTGSPAEFARLSARLDELCSQIGRDPREIRRSVATGVLVGRDAADLANRAERMRACVPPLAEAVDVCAAAREMGWLAGTVQEVSAELRALAAVGVERAILGHYDLGASDTLEVVASMR